MHADATASGVQNNVDTNRKAQEALDAHNQATADLQKKKRDAGMTLGNGGGKNGATKSKEKAGRASGMENVRVVRE